jgi:hypothetical protein
MEIGEN